MTPSALLVGLKGWINSCRCQCDACMVLRLALNDQEQLLVAIELADHPVTVLKRYDA